MWMPGCGARALVGTASPPAWGAVAPLLEVGLRPSITPCEGGNSCALGTMTDPQEPPTGAWPCFPGLCNDELAVPIIHQHQLVGS